MTKGCYTCRRRRIICDNGLPTCRKCRDAGKECLGYQKPLVWVKGGVASRGKMMGRSFDEVNKSAPGTNTQAQAQAPPAEALAAVARTVFFSHESSSDADSSASYVSPEADAWVHETAENVPEDEVTRSAPEEPETRLVHVPQGSPPAEYIPAPWGLVDPLLKDLSPASRFYIFHYNQHVVSDFSLYTQVKNPYRDLLAVVGSSAVLSHGLSAMGALHYSLLSDWDSSVMPWSSDNQLANGPPMSPEEIENAITPAASRRPSSKAYEHFLEYKQRALNQLAMDLSNPMMQKDDRTLAAIVVLALLDLYESGSGAWSYHIEGAKNLLKSRPDNQLGQGIIEGLDTFAIDGCLIMEIMGSTLARPGALSKPFYSSSMGPAILKRLEETSWVGCPAYLLEVIFFVHALWYPDSESSTTTTPQPSALPSFQPGQPFTLDSFSALLQGIRNFDPISWAEEMQAFFFIDDLSARVALATAYQAAVYLYTSRVLSRTRSGFDPPWTDVGLPSDHASVATDLITQICLVPHADPHFKCLIWPTFIAGAESRRPSQRALILEKLGSLYGAVTSVNVRNAAWVLRLMWQNHDFKHRQRRSDLPSDVVEEQFLDGSDMPILNADGAGDGDDNDDYDNSFDWVDELDQSRLDWLFI